MTANVAGLIPGALVLIAEDRPSDQPRRAVVLRTVLPGFGTGQTVEVCVGPCARTTAHSTDFCNAVGFAPEDLILVPAEASDNTYGVGVAGAT